MNTKKSAGVVDCTPTWRALLPTLLELAANATTQDARRTAREELERMASAADRWNAEMPGMLNAAKLVMERFQPGHIRQDFDKHVAKAALGTAIHKTEKGGRDHGR